MALSKPLFFNLKSHIKPYHRSPFFLSLRPLSFATPEEAAAERRRRKRRLRIEPPLNALRHHNPPKQQNPQNFPSPNPNSPKVPETVSVLAGNRLNLHNRILTLIRENDLEEAALLVRHSIYSNCRPTIFTCNAVLAAQLRMSRYADFLSLHRFITQAGVAPNVVTHNLLLNAYCDCRRTDTALEHHRVAINDAPFNPSPTTYRILTRGLVAASPDDAKVDRALALRDEMFSKGLAADAAVYSYLMLGLVKIDQPDKALELFEELKEKLGGVIDDGIVYGSLMKAYFKKGMEKEAMDILNGIVLGGSDSKLRMGAVAYNSALDALSKNGKIDDAAKLFDRMMEGHNPPRWLTVNLGSFNVMVDMLIGEKKFTEAVEIFWKMGEKQLTPDTPSCNNLIEQLCSNGKVVDAEEIYREMGEKGVIKDEYTHVLLMDACFIEGRVDDAAQYFRKMLEAGLTPNLAAYTKVIGGLLKVSRIDDAKEFFDKMVEELKPDPASYDTMFRTLCDAQRLDDVLKMVRDILKADIEATILTPELREFVSEALRKEGRGEELTRLYEEREREKAEALAREAEKAKASANAVRSLAASASALAFKRETADASTAAAEAVPTDGNVAAGEEEQDKDTQAVAAQAPTDTVGGQQEDLNKDAGSVQDASIVGEGSATGHVAA
ncbi:hypothetical protein ACLOJK_009887 [Asimina triloba]